MTKEVDIRLTEAACARLAELCADGSSVRLSVREAGCSGLEYEMALVDAPDPEDLRIEGPGFTLCIDPESYRRALKGLRLDFQRDLLSSGFVYDNPNVRGECGCGRSFTVDPID